MAVSYTHLDVYKRQHIDRACLDKKLLAGNYDGVCQIELFDMDTLELLGTLEEKITITIQK